MNEIVERIEESHERFLRTEKEDRMIMSEQIIDYMDFQVRNMVNLWLEKFNLEECPEVWTKLYVYLNELEETLTKSLRA